MWRNTEGGGRQEFFGICWIHCFSGHLQEAVFKNSPILRNKAQYWKRSFHASKDLLFVLLQMREINVVIKETTTNQGNPINRSRKNDCSHLRSWNRFLIQFKGTPKCSIVKPGLERNESSIRAKFFVLRLFIVLTSSGVVSKKFPSFMIACIIRMRGNTHFIPKESNLKITDDQSKRRLF